jgi:sortase A
MSRRGARFLFVALVLLAVGFGAAGGRIYAKAWLAQRLLHRAWAATQTASGPVKPWPWADTWPVARLSLPDRGIDLIVLADASGRSLAFGPGLVAGSAPPGAPGNTVLSGHRDTQFRFLKDLVLGDRIRLETADGTRLDYAVTGTLVIDAQDVEILWDTDETRLTLVTCFPFDAVVPGGPLRYVVQADRVAADGVRGPAREVEAGPWGSTGRRRVNGPAGLTGPGPARLGELHVGSARQDLIALAGDDVGPTHQGADTLGLVQQALGHASGRVMSEDTPPWLCGVSLKPGGATTRRCSGGRSGRARARGPSLIPRA